MTKNVKRPQMPKRRNFVKKHMDQLHKPQTHRDRSKYDRYEDYLKDQLDDYVDDSDEDAEIKKKFVAAIKGEEYDPDLKLEWEDWQWREAVLANQETWDDYDIYDDDDDYDY